jgi:hypothetical protein
LALCSPIRSDSTASFADVSTLSAFSIPSNDHRVAVPTRAATPTLGLRR